MEFPMGVSVDFRGFHGNFHGKHGGNPKIVAVVVVFGLEEEKKLDVIFYFLVMREWDASSRDISRPIWGSVTHIPTTKYTQQCPPCRSGIIIIGGAAYPTNEHIVVEVFTTSSKKRFNLHSVPSDVRSCCLIR